MNLHVKKIDASFQLDHLAQQNSVHLLLGGWVSWGLSSAVPELATDPELEKKLLHHLSDLSLTLPTDAVSIRLAISTVMNDKTRLRTATVFHQFVVRVLTLSLLPSFLSQMPLPLRMG